MWAEGWARELADFLHDAAATGDDTGAAELDQQLKPLYRAMSVAPPAVAVKAALELLGVVSAHVRLPMAPASADEREAIRRALTEQGLLTSGAGNLA